MMSDLDVLVSSPFPTESLQGNSVSARRIASRIADLELRTETSHGYDTQDCKVLIALHARRSLPALKAFRSRYPDRLAIVVATGTDLYRDLPSGDLDVIEGMRLADAIVTYQDVSARDIPAEFADKAQVIWKSVELPEAPEPLPKPPQTPITFTILAHLRQTKDPFLPVKSLQHIDQSPSVQINHFGNPLEANLVEEAQEWMKREARYHWRESIPREAVAAAIRSSHVTINTGRTEGGSNAVCESIVLGTPVLATETPANIGFLGADYAGYFPVGDAEALAQLISKCRQPNSSLLAELTGQVNQRAPRFSPESESAGWKKLISQSCEL